MIEILIEFFQEYYYWLLSFHIISVISWMAGMFYLPRLFVYHTRLEVGSDASEMFTNRDYVETYISDGKKTQAGNATELAKHFNTSIELVILEEEDVYSKTQAEQIIRMCDGTRTTEQIAEALKVPLPKVVQTVAKYRKHGLKIIGKTI